MSEWCGVSSFWQTAAQHTFLSNFQSTLHLLWPPSKTLWKLLKPVNFYSLFTAWSPLASTGLYTHILHINCTSFFLSSLCPPLSFLPPQLLLLLRLLSSSFQPPPHPPTTLKSLSCVEGPPFNLRETGWLLYPLSNLHTEVTTWGRASERRRKERWCGRRGKGSSLQLLKRTSGPLWSTGFSCYPFVSSPLVYLKALSLSIKENSGKGRRLKAVKILRCLTGGKKVLAMKGVHY